MTHETRIEQTGGSPLRSYMNTHHQARCSCGWRGKRFWFRSLAMDEARSHKQIMAHAAFLGERTKTALMSKKDEA